MNSLCLNFYIVHYLLDKHLLPSEWAFAVYLATAIWVGWIGLARVYMGLHTPIDIGAGTLLGILVLVFYLALDGSQQYAHLSLLPFQSVCIVEYCLICSLCFVIVCAH